MRLRGRVIGFLIVVMLVPFSDLNALSDEDILAGDARRIDLKEFHTSGLSNLGVTDFSDAGLIKMLEETNDGIIAYHALLLLGRRGVKNAVPAMEKWLVNGDIRDQMTAAEALLMLGNENGVGLLKGVMEGEKEYYASDAAGVLAEFGYTETIPYLLKLSKSEVWSYRTNTVFHMRILAEKLDAEPAVKGREATGDVVNSLIGHMIEVLSDNDVRVRRQAITHLHAMKVKNKKPIIEGFKKKVDKETDKDLKRSIRMSIRMLEEEMK
jgi:HEAT repeat protein